LAMIIITTNIFVMLLVLFFWMLNLFVFLSAIRFFYVRHPKLQDSPVCRLLWRLTDPIPQAVNRCLVALLRRRVPTWLIWVTLIAAILVVQQLVARVLIAII